ncbi:MAG: sigma-70 family RNA polymerase sigma factor [Pseudomonadota bacterium]
MRDSEKIKDSAAIDDTTSLQDLMRRDWGRLLSVLISDLGDFALAEDSLADAFASALTHWSPGRPTNPPANPPSNPRAWLLQVARRKAIDRLRRQQNHRTKLPELTYLRELDAQASAEPEQEIRDERLRLIFTACHPALDQKTRLALTLRSLCGLTTGEIARAFLDKEATMAQRLARARNKIARAGIPYQVPKAEDLEQRLSSVLTVIYLIFNEGYSVSQGEDPIRHDLCQEAIRLARELRDLLPQPPEVLGLLALLLLTYARHGARLSPEGAAIPLEEQDRSLWDQEVADEGLALLERALRRGRAGPFQLQAVISALHVEAETFAATDWAEILLAYDRLMGLADNPVVALNRAVALSFVKGPAAGLAALPGQLDHYQPFHAARADILRRAGQHKDAKAAYDRAIGLTRNSADRRFLQARKARLSLLES